ncbi:MAG: type II toxin-antitoxin system ParD family antitoxin [Aestuariivirga sp.]
MNFSLGKNWDKYVSEQVESGQFNNASEVVRDALRRQQEYLIKLEALKKDISLGVASVKAGKARKVSAAEIIAKAKARKSAA